MSEKTLKPKMTYEAFEQYYREARSKHTFKAYKRGIELFTEWFGKSADEILQLRHEDHASDDPHRKKRFLRELEKFRKWLIDEQGYGINTSRNYIARARIPYISKDRENFKIERFLYIWRFTITFPLMSL